MSFNRYVTRLSTPGLLLILLACAPEGLLSAATRSPESIVREYISAKDREAKLAMLSPDYRIWFGKREGPGMTKPEAARMLEWDFALNPRHRIEEVKVAGRDVVVRIHEDNDFSLLIGYPGWDAVSTYTVDESGLITSQLYVPKEGQPDWKPYLERALPWLREHRAEALARIYPNNRLSRTSESAREWVKQLRDWRAATGQPDPTRD
ncbi:MAG TPA: hypothetical protein VJQ56_07245 [Blastocatellia bacterium]|nr:hypothetical protein [Blastocatellia bacterium]